MTLSDVDNIARSSSSSSTDYGIAETEPMTFLSSSETDPPSSAALLGGTGMSTVVEGEPASAPPRSRSSSFQAADVVVASAELKSESPMSEKGGAGMKHVTKLSDVGTETDDAATMNRFVQNQDEGAAAHQRSDIVEDYSVKDMKGADHFQRQPDDEESGEQDYSRPTPGEGSVAPADDVAGDERVIPSFSNQNKPATSSEEGKEVENQVDSCATTAHHHHGEEEKAATIDRAIRFLNHRSISDLPLEKKVEYLKDYKKDGGGLTDEQIETVLEIMRRKKSRNDVKDDQGEQKTLPPSRHPEKPLDVRGAAGVDGSRAVGGNEAKQHGSRRGSPQQHPQQGGPSYSDYYRPPYPPPYYPQHHPQHHWYPPHPHSSYPAVPPSSAAAYYGHHPPSPYAHHGGPPPAYNSGWNDAARSGLHHQHDPNQIVSYPDESVYNTNPPSSSPKPDHVSPNVDRSVPPESTAREDHKSQLGGAARHGTGMTVPPVAMQQQQSESSQPAPSSMVIAATVGAGCWVSITALAAWRWLNGGDFELFPPPSMMSMRNDGQYAGTAATTTPEVGTGVNDVCEERGEEDNEQDEGTSEMLTVEQQEMNVDAVDETRPMEDYSALENNRCEDEEDVSIPIPTTRRDGGADVENDRFDGYRYTVNGDTHTKNVVLDRASEGDNHISKEIHSLTAAINDLRSTHERALKAKETKSRHEEGSQLTNSAMDLLRRTDSSADVKASPNVGREANDTDDQTASSLVMIQQMAEVKAELNSIKNVLLFQKERGLEDGSDQDQQQESMALTSRIEDAISSMSRIQSCLVGGSSAKVEGVPDVTDNIRAALPSLGDVPCAGSETVVPTNEHSGPDTSAMTQNGEAEEQGENSIGTEPEVHVGAQMFGRVSLPTFASPTLERRGADDEHQVTSAVGNSAPSAAETGLAKALHKMLEDNNDGEHGVSLSAGLKMIEMYMNNIIKNPTVPRYRKVHMLNPSYTKNVAPLVGAKEFLLEAGFVEKPLSNVLEWTARNGDCSEHPMSGTADASNSFIGTGDGASGSIAILKEACDLLTQIRSNPHTGCEENIVPHESRAAQNGISIAQRVVAEASAGAGAGAGDAGSSGRSKDVPAAPYSHRMRVTPVQPLRKTVPSSPSPGSFIISPPVTNKKSVLGEDCFADCAKDLERTKAFQQAGTPLGVTEEGDEEKSDCTASPIDRTLYGETNDKSGESDNRAGQSVAKDCEEYKTDLIGDKS